MKMWAIFPFCIEMVYLDTLKICLGEFKKSKPLRTLNDKKINNFNNLVIIWIYAFGV